MTSPEEQYERYWKHEEAAENYVVLIDELLAMHSREAQKQIMELYEQKEFTSTYIACDPRLVSGQILVNIARDEERMDRPQRYIDRFDSLRQFILEWDRLKFLLWELEFINRKDAEEDLFAYIMELGISDLVIAYLILTSSFHKEQMIIRLANLMISRENVVMSYLLLRHGCDICPESQPIAQLHTRLQAIVEGT